MTVHLLWARFREGFEEALIGIYASDEIAQAHVSLHWHRFRIQAVDVIS